MTHDVDKTGPVSRRTIGEGRWLRLVDRGGWEHVERVNVSGVVAVVALTDDGSILLLEQYRHAIAKWVVELPAGLAGDGAGGAGEDLCGAARRELLEETGYAAREWHLLTAGPTSAGMSTEVITFFLARGARRIGAGGGDGSEQIRVFEVPLERVAAFIAEREALGAVTDPKVYTGLYFAGRAGGKGASVP
ncbi:MAG: NUDIX hydrolase [Planctomycetota bacterium]